MKIAVTTINQSVNFLNRHRSMFDSGKTYSLELKLFRQPRSGSQNALMHVLFAEIAEQSGYSPEDVKTLLKEKFAPRIAIEIGEDIAVVPMGTSKMSLEQGTEFIERIYQFGAENSCVFQEQ